ncbi:MAG TPA: hypothetical protein VH592_01135 [Gemmataceae bacterium]
MSSCTRWLKVGYFLALTTALVLLLSKPEPARAQRSIAYAFLPGATVNSAAMAAVAANSTPLTSYNQAASMLAQAQQALDPFGVGQSGGMGLLGGIGMGGTGVGGGLTGQGAAGGGLRGIGGIGGIGGMMGMGGGMRGIGGIGGIAGMGGLPMGGGFGGGVGGGVGGLGGFAGKGFGGFNGKKAL